MTSALLLTGGPDYAHDFHASSSALAEVLAGAGVECTVVHHPDEAAALLPGHYRMLVIDALRWRMLGARYDAMRAEWGYHTPAATRDAITAFVASGGMSSVFLAELDLDRRSVDLSATEYLDSSAIGMLLILRDRALDRSIN